MYACAMPLQEDDEGNSEEHRHEDVVDEINDCGRDAPDTRCRAEPVVEPEESPIGKCLCKVSV